MDGLSHREEGSHADGLDGDAGDEDQRPGRYEHGALDRGNGRARVRLLDT